MSRPRRQGEPRHGTYLGYSSDGCRCAPCRDAKAAYERGRRGGDASLRSDPWGPLTTACETFLDAVGDERTDALVLGSIAAGIRECVDDLSAHWARRHPYPSDAPALAEHLAVHVEQQA